MSKGTVNVPGASLLELKQVETVAKNAATAASNAETVAKNAATTASNAATAASNAESAAKTAAESAENAKKAAEEAAGNAGDGGGTSAVYTATIGTEWEEDADTGVKFQTVAIEGVEANHFAKIDAVMTHERTTEGYAAFVEEHNQFLECITNGDAETVDGGVKFYIYGEANTVEIPIVVEVG